ncbi:OB-fold putative lipoprotein [Myxococcus sp. RHSTA-1-4]|uniref:OB-fold putative lipoprotein n=1 Tax=Myxococcus sp. RHSTA-1-4 TaxID=2874601 RepID=UPI001CBBB262|nr:OB-fold putative lipoprotein [Myxococcus sp. RHSTA-1-4]MBZ4423395.1 OB-fold putative lipoprotein [Myxococcus sp. RHSTA-1-4]
MSTKKILFIIFGVLAVYTVGSVLLRGSRGGRGPSASARTSAEDAAKKSARWVEISTLLSEYRDNEVRADSSFKGTWVQTSGYVDDVKRDFLNSIYVTLGTGQALEVPQVQCFFADSEAKKAATLTRGARVTVRGRVDGLMMNVLVKRCEFVGL